MKPENYCLPDSSVSEDFDTRIEMFHDLMPHKIWEILLIATPYDAFIMEEDGSLASKIINEYRGLNLSRPPRLTKAASATEAMQLLSHRPFGMVIVMPGLEDMDTDELVMRIKTMRPGLPVVLLTHSQRDSAAEHDSCSVIDNEFVWSGNSELLLALIKSVEDRLNVESDTRNAMVRVLILVEDSPVYRSFFLPLIYKVVVRQTISVLADSLNEEHRLLKMRARPKILVAENYETAMDLFCRFRPYVFGVISDTRFPTECRMTEDAGIRLLSRVREEIPWLPVLLMSSETRNRERAEQIQAVFVDKNSPELQSEIESFFREYLGFGDFIFREKGSLAEIGRASSLRELENLLPDIPDEPLLYHARRNRFSNWLMARSEIGLASRFAKVQASDFESVDRMRSYIAESIHSLRQCRQKGLVAQFDERSFDPAIMDFVRIGNGSLGGKARGLAFIAGLLNQNPELERKFPDVDIRIPGTLVIATSGFEDFVNLNQLHYSRICDCGDAEIRRRFLEADLPGWLYNALRACLKQMNGPLAVRSSSLWEDAPVQSYAGLYKTFMIPNNHNDLYVRLHHLVTAVKLVYASTWFERPLAFSRRISRQFREDSMAVMIQQVAGNICGNYFYPAISGVALSRNYYPVGHMKPEDGIARISLGLGKILEEGDSALRFCPRYPEFMPQFSTVPDILANAQRFFYALRMKRQAQSPSPEEDDNLVRRDVDEAEEEFPVRSLSSTYIPEENRIRDTAWMPGPKILTFAPVLRHGLVPLPELLDEMLEICRKGVGGPVEIEFSVTLPPDKKHRPAFYFLQLRPLAAGEESRDVEITDAEIVKALCFSAHSLGHGRNQEMTDVVYVKPENFDAASTVRIAGEIGKINSALVKEKRRWLLAGPGRWGSADRWLGIPVKWKDISGVGAMIEVRDGSLNADPSQGSHFFQKITARGIHYITLEQNSSDFLRWERLQELPPVNETRFLRHVRLERPFLLKNDGRRSRCVILENRVGDE